MRAISKIALGLSISLYSLSVNANPFAIVSCDAVKLTMLQVDIPSLDFKPTTSTSSCAEVLAVLTDANYNLISVKSVGSYIIYTLTLSPFNNNLNAIPAIPTLPVVNTNNLMQ